jgi:hypothetical protein
MIMRRLLRFLGWIDRKPGDMWPFPFAGFQPRHVEPGSVVYPFRPLLQALKDKDAALYELLGGLSPHKFVEEWRKTYPEDFA